MKKILLSLFVSLNYLMLSGLCAGNPNDFVFRDDFSDPSAWQSQGNGAVNVSNGRCNFHNVYSGYYNRVFQPVGRTLSDTYWCAETAFAIHNPNPYGFGTGEVVMALTAGSLDFMSFDFFHNYEETYQDGIAVVLVSGSSKDNDINDWYFMVEAKNGDIRTFDENAVIHADAAIGKYYVRLERISIGTTQLSVFSDSLLTNHLPGSPIRFEIDPGIARLTTVQHGTMTPGNFTRLINGDLDNDVIYDDWVNTGLLSFDPSNGKNILVFPNPSTSIITIKKEDRQALGENSYYRIFNLLGVEIAASMMDASRQIDVSNLVEGVFLLMIYEPEKTCWAKFLKKN
jgi:hypothetical protein